MIWLAIEKAEIPKTSNTTLGHYQEGEYKAEAVKIDCVTFPGFENKDAFNAYLQGHYSMPYVDWLPLEKEVTGWVNQRYSWEL